MSLLPTGILFDPACKEHNPGPFHPECPARLDAVLEGIEKATGGKGLSPIPSRRIREEELLLCHDAGYLRSVRLTIEAGALQLATGDTDVGPGTLDAAYVAAGAMLAAVDAVMGKRVRNAFCAVRPPGHHASAGRGMGFCVFNNLALAARYAQRKHGVERVLIADWDVHHGNGTQELFYSDPTVFFFSTHQWPFYPGTGAAHETGLGDGKGYTLNCPFARGSGGREVLGAFREMLVPAMRAFKPEFVCVSAGFDGRTGDRLGGFELTDDDFAQLTAVVMEIAEQYAGGRLVSTLEGGYSLSGLASAAGAHVRRLTVR